MGKRFAIVIGVAAVVLGLLVFPAGAAAGTLDQSQTNSESGLDFGGSESAAVRIQTFTAGLTGQLDQVDVHVRSCRTGMTGGITVEVWTVEAGGPTDTLARADVLAANISTSSAFVPVTFATPATVTSGTQYALVLAAPGATDCTTPTQEGPYEWARGLGNPYPAGEALEPVGSGFVSPGGDHAFKTYVASPDDGSPPPPDGALPSNEFSFGKVEKNKRKGTAKLTVNVPGGGELELAKTKKVKADEDLAGAEGKEKLAIKPKGKAKKKLNDKGKAKVKASVTYTPDGGNPNTKRKKIQLVER